MRTPKATIVVESAGRGGAEFYVYDLAAYARRHFPVTVALPFTPQSAPFRELLAGGGIPCEELAQAPARYLKNFRMALGYFKERRDRFFHFSLSHPDSCRWSLLAASLLKLDYIITEHLVPPAPYRESLYFAATHLLFNPLKKLSYRRARKVIAVSAKTKESLVAAYGMPESKIIVIHNGIDTSAWERASAGPGLPAELGITAEHLVLGCVARLSPEKGHTYLLQALPELTREFPFLRTILIGDGPQQEQLAREAESLGLSHAVRFLGHRGDVANLLKMADIFVLPSLNEGFPFTILEAMALAKPVVATRVAGVPEAVTDGDTGFLVPPRDPGALAGAIRQLLRDPERRRRMGQAGQKKVKASFSRESMLHRTLELYQRSRP